MKVKDLIEKLQTLPGDMIVVRPGYEGGVTELSGIKTKKVVLNYNEAWYYGEHELVEDLVDRNISIETANTADVILIY